MVKIILSSGRKNAQPLSNRSCVLRGFRGGERSGTPTDVPSAASLSESTFNLKKQVAFVDTERKFECCFYLMGGA